MTLSRSKPMKRTRLKPVNRKRRAKLFAEDFGGKAYLEFIHGLECAACGSPCEYTEAAHLTSRGAGGKVDVVVPLCGSRFNMPGCHHKYDAHDPELRALEPRLRSLAKQLRAEWLAQEKET